MKYTSLTCFAACLLMTACQTTQPCSPTSVVDARNAIYGSVDAYNFIRSTTAESDPVESVRITTAGLALPDVTDRAKRRLLHLRADANFRTDNVAGGLSDLQTILDEDIAFAEESFWLVGEIARINSGGLPLADGPDALIRIPPRMPSRANKSGHCQTRFDIRPDGSLDNISTDYCTDSVFEQAARDSLTDWKFETNDTRTVGAKTTTRFLLLNKCGAELPE